MAKLKQLPGQQDMFNVIDMMLQTNYKPVKFIKVSQSMWECLKRHSIDMSTLPEAPISSKSGYIGRFDGVTIVVDDDVELYEIEYLVDNYEQ